MEFVATATFSALLSIFAAVLTILLKAHVDEEAEEKEKRELLQSQYLNPLRLYLVENHFRLSEILDLVRKDGKSPALLFLSAPQEVSHQSPEWFNGEGTYLVSSCYLTSCLFYYQQKVRADFPYIRLGSQDDTTLLALLLKVSRAFLEDMGIFYATQPSIGIDMYLEEPGRLLSYREFCQHLMDPNKRVWFDRLIAYYIDTGRGEKLHRVEDAIRAIQNLTEFLDKIVGGGTSIKKSLVAVGITSV